MLQSTIHQSRKYKEVQVQCLAAFLSNRDNKGKAMPHDERVRLDMRHRGTRRVYT